MSDGTSPKSSFHYLAGKKIIVAGAGIAGLAFVISLRKLWKEHVGKFPEIVHYERDDERSAISRDGFSISLRGDDLSPGLQSLQKMNILDKLLEFGITRKGDDRGYMGLWSLNWRRMVRVRDEAPNGLPISSMRIARSKLRSVLLDTATEHGTIIWGVACTEVLSSLDAGIRVRLSNREEDSCDFLIVADGANSKLRASVRPADKLNFTGAVSICATSRFSGPSPEPVGRDWGIVPSGKGVALFVSPLDEQSAFWSLSYIAHAPREQQQQPLSTELKRKLLQEARERGAVFREPFQTLVEQSDTATLMVLNAMDKKPFAHSAASGVPQCVFFIGDSNHAISQFAGNGANMALLDGYDLAECLCNYKILEKTLMIYDKRSMPRAATAVRNAHFCISLVHSSGLRWFLSQSLLLFLGAVLSIWNFAATWIEKV